MKKKNIVNLIRYHVEGNENAFREEAYGIANEFDSKGDNELAEYIMALMSDTNVIYTQNFNYESEFLEEVNLKSTSLFLPTIISQELIGIANAINNKAEVNKFLFEGAPGTGKTEAVKQLARVLDRKVYMVDFSMIIDSKLGQTQKNITSLFKEINSFSKQDSVIFLFDEIDALALDRTNSHDLREMGRATSTLLKGLDNLSSNAIIIATTNLFENFDKAMTRRFDYIIHFNNYSKEDLMQVAEKILDNILKNQKNVEKNKRLFRKILSLYDVFPYPGELKNIIKTSVIFSNMEDKYDYFRRLYFAVKGNIPMDIIELKNEGFTVREIEILTGISKSSVSRELKGD